MPPAPRGATKASAARGGGRGRRRQAGGSGEHDSSERWLVTYADLLTVLLALFIVLFAISALNESKFQQLKYSLAAVFGDGSIGVLDGSPALNDANDNSVAQPPTVPEMPDTDKPSVPAVPNLGGWLSAEEGTNSGTKGSADTPVSAEIDTGDEDLDKQIQEELDNFEQVRIEIDQHLDHAGLTGAAQYSIDQRGLIVTVVTDALVFPGNSATLLPRGEKLLAAIAPAIAKVPNNVEVDGFTNQVDVSTYPYPSGWELSSARASSVVRYLESHGVVNRQLSAVGFSDQKPLVPPDDPLSVTRNRRVEIVVLSTLPSLAGDALAAAANARDKAATSADTGAAASNDATGQAARGSQQATVAGSPAAPTTAARPN